MKHLVTIERHLLDQSKTFQKMTGELANMLNDVALAAKLIRKEIVRAGLANVLGDEGSVNVQGEIVKKLDIIANEFMVKIIGEHGRFALMGSEENEDIIYPPRHENGKYLLLFDPLDGSSNIDVNISVGTIFSIYKAEEGGKPCLETCLKKGTEQIAAGYVLYGSSVMLVYTAGNGVFGFTYDPTIGEFMLSHSNIQIPKKSKYYSINEGLYSQLTDGVKQYLDHVKSDDKEQGLPLSARYVGSLVADFHRNLLSGGIYMYPGTINKPSGKLRLMYEANPLAFICEQAGGSATDGTTRILDIQPTDLHQRVPLFIGNRADVETATAFAHI